MICHDDMMTGGKSGALSSKWRPRVMKPVFGLAGPFGKNMAKYAVRKIYYIVYYIGYSLLCFCSKRCKHWGAK
jgi:hypothetical protein